jgi:hypothetical protein
MSNCDELESDTPEDSGSENSDDYRQYLITEENKDTIEQTAENVELTVEHWGPSIAYVRDEFITYELCKRAVENHDGAISSIKRHLLTEEEYYELCIISLTENGWNLKYVPESVQTQELVDIAINESCWAIEFAVDKFKTYENCLSTVTRNGQTIQHVPMHLMDRVMCETAVKAPFYCLNCIPKEFVTRELCELAVRANGENIKDVPEEFMSTELAFIAVKSSGNNLDSYSGYNISYIPAKYITKEIILEAVKKTNWCYHIIPKEALNDDIDMAVLDISPESIDDMNQSEEKCLHALKIDPRTIGFIEKKNITIKIRDYILSLPESVRNKLDIQHVL